MAICPCNEEIEIEVNQLEVEEGDVVTCPECGAALTVLGLAPVELELVDDDDLVDDDEDEEEDEDDEDDEADDEDEDDEDWDDDDEDEEWEDDED